MTLWKRCSFPLLISVYFVALLASEGLALELPQVNNVQVSRDGQWLVYEKSVDTTNSKGVDIFLSQIDGLNEKRLTHLGNCRRPSFSPSGQLIAFHYDQGIYLMNLSGGNKKLVADCAGDSFLTSSNPVTWFNDSELLIYGVSWGEFDQAELGITSHIAKYTLDGDRRWIAGITAKRNFSEAVAHPNRNRVLTIVDSKLMSLTLGLQDAILLAKTGKQAEIACSPNQEKLAYTKNGDIYIMNLDGSNPHKMGPGKSLSWKENGSDLFFLRPKNKTPVLYTFRSGSQKNIPVAEFLQEKRQLVAKLEELTGKNDANRECLMAQFDLVQQLKNDVTHQQKYLERIEKRDNFEHVKDKKNSQRLHESLKAQQSSLDVILQSLDTLLTQVEGLATLPVGYIERFNQGYDVLSELPEYSSLIEFVGRAVHTPEVDLSAAQQEIEHLQKQLKTYDVDVKDSIQAYLRKIEQEKLNARERTEELLQVQELRLRETGIAIGIGLGSVLVLWLIYKIFLAKRLKMRRVQKRVKADFNHRLARLNDSLKTVQQEMVYQQKKELVWEQVLNNFKSFITNVLLEDTEKSLSKMDEMGKFYNQMVKKILKMDIPEEHKMKLIKDFEVLFTAGIEDATSGTPLEDRLENIYDSLQGEDITNRTL